MSGTYILSLDLGGKKLKYTLFGLKTGEIADQKEIPSGPFYRPVSGEDRCILDNFLENKRIGRGDGLSEYLKAGTAQFLKEGGHDVGDIAGVGISLGGIVLNDGGKRETVTFNRVDVPERFRVKDEYGQLHINATGGLMELFPDVSVIGANDCNCTGNAQSLVYEQRGIDPLKTFYITIGQGFGGGGSRMDIDEVGHTKIHGIITELRMLCGCGEQDCIDAYASGGGMPNFARKFLELYDEIPRVLDMVTEYESLGGKLVVIDDIKKAVGSSALRKIDDLRSEHIFEEASNGDQFARYLTNKFADMTGYVISSTANVHGLEVFGLGGSVARNNPEYVDMINHHTNSLVEGSKISPKGITVELSPLGSVANDYGAASLVLPPEYKPEWVKTMVKRAEEKKS